MGFAIDCLTFIGFKVVNFLKVANFPAPVITTYPVCPDFFGDLFGIGFYIHI